MNKLYKEYVILFGPMELIKNAQFENILGQTYAKNQLKGALLARRNVIIVGPPGVGKTTIAKTVATLMGKDAPFVRIQGSPDLTAEDLIGDIDPIRAMKVGPKEAFVPGKIFKAKGGVLFFDEVNRCTEKLQNALLQVLEEKIVTIGTHEVDLKTDFLFIGTMNPEDSSTEKLSDVFLDRFDLIEMGYPETEHIEEQIIAIHGQKQVTVPENIRKAIIGFIHRLRHDERLEKKPSVRATLGLYDRAQTHAMIEGNNKVTFADLSAIVISVLAHRIGLKASVKYLQTPEDYIRKEFRAFTRESELDDGP